MNGKKALFTFVVLLCFIINTFGGNSPDKRPTFLIYGYLRHLVWANQSNKLAILFKDQNNNSFVYIIDAKQGKIVKKLFIQTDTQSGFIVWSKDDCSLLIVIEKDVCWYTEYYYNLVTDTLKTF